MQSRLVTVTLADASHKLPLPGKPGLYLEGEITVDPMEPFWAQCIGDGSVVIVPPKSGAPAKPARR